MFEYIFFDYVIFKIVQFFEDVGGDIFWVFGYEVYDCLSFVFQKLVESLIVMYYQFNFVRVKEVFGVELIDQFCGVLENNGLDFKVEQYVYLYVERG